VFITWGRGKGRKEKRGEGRRTSVISMAVFCYCCEIVNWIQTLPSTTVLHFLSYLLLHLLLNINGTMQMITSCEYLNFQCAVSPQWKFTSPPHLLTPSLPLFLSHSLSRTLSVSHFPALSPFSLDISDNAALVLHLQLHPQESGSLTFYVPVILMEVDEGD
jgi:hypothetical protein